MRSLQINQTLYVYVEVLHVISLCCIVKQINNDLNQYGHIAIQRALWEGKTEYVNILLKQRCIDAEDMVYVK